MSQAHPANWSAVFRSNPNTFLSLIYQITLFREPDPDGFHFYLTRLSHSSINAKERILLDLLRSTEYQDIVSGKRFESPDKAVSLAGVYSLLLNRLPSESEATSELANWRGTQEVFARLLASSEHRDRDPVLWLLRQSLHQTSKEIFARLKRRSGDGASLSDLLIPIRLRQRLNATYDALSAAHNLAHLTYFGGALSGAPFEAKESAAANSTPHAQLTFSPNNLTDLKELLSILAEAPTLTVDSTVRSRLDDILPELLRSPGPALTAREIATLSGIIRTEPTLLALRDYSLAHYANESDWPLIRNALINQYYDAPSADSWIFQHEPLKEERFIFNQILLPALHSSEAHALFLHIKRLTLIQLAASPSIDWDQILGILQNSSLHSPQPINPSSTRDFVIYPTKQITDLGTLLAISYFHPALLIDIAHQAHDGAEFLTHLREFQSLRPTLLVLTKIPFPMGGGESYLHDTLKITSALGFRNIWASFADKFWKPHTCYVEKKTPLYLDVYSVESDLSTNIETAIGHFGADVIHSQGILNSHVIEAARKNRTPALIGYHFWDGLVTLGSTRNQNILAQINEHRLAPQKKLPRSIRRYVASQFMSEVYHALGGNDPLEIMYPLTLGLDPVASGAAPTSAGHILQLNVSPLKGGKIFLECVRRTAKHINFLCVNAEPSGDEFDVALARVARETGKLQISSYADAHSLYRKARMVLIPSLVDETFCRVAYEAAKLGIPVLSTDRGNLRHLLGDSGYYLPGDDSSAWVSAINALYDNAEELRRIGERQKAHIDLHYSLAKEHAKFIGEITSLTKSGPRYNIGLYSTLNTQGLGYQTVGYGRALMRYGFRTHVLSFRPYGDPTLLSQQDRDSATWDDPSSFSTRHYSLNTREEITTAELDTFVRTNSIGKLIIPEICWNVNWEKLRHLSIKGLFLYAVPNVETVRGSEIPEHSSTIYRNLCPSRAIYNILESRHVPNISYIGHGFGKAWDAAKQAKKLNILHSTSSIDLLHVGGHNPLSRKNTSLVVQAFVEAAKSRNDLRLTVALFSDRQIPFPMHPQITYVYNIRDHVDLLNAYWMHSASIQVSTHEGIGLGFYESLSQYTPVITLDVPPHNEVVSRRTGWLLRAQLEPLDDNDDSVWMKARLAPHDLSDLLREITIGSISTKVHGLRESFFEEHDERAFRLRFTRELFRHN